jgi:hypothetical protein
MLVNRFASIVVLLTLILSMTSFSMAAGSSSYPVFEVNATDGSSWAEGALLQEGVNIVYGSNIGDAVSLPAATGSGKQIDLHLHASFFVRVWVQPTDHINQQGEGIAYVLYPRQRLRFIDVGPGLWDFSTNLPMFYPILSDLDTTPGGGQFEARYLFMGTNVLKQATAHGDSARLPFALGGVSPLLIYNDTDFYLDIFPNYGQKINQQPFNKALPVAPGKLVLLQDIGPGPNQWVGGVIDAGYALQFQSKGGIFNPESETAYYVGQGIEATAYAQVQRIRIPRGGRITSINSSFINQGLGSSEVSSLYLRKNNAEDVLISPEIKNDFIINEGVNDELNITVRKGDYIELKWVTPNWVNKPTYVSINGSIYIE